MRNPIVQKHIQLLAYFAIIAGILFVCWGYLISTFEVTPDHLPTRALISLVFVCFGVGVLKSNMDLLKIEWVFATLSLLPMIYAFYITYQHGPRAVWITGTSLILYGVLNFLTYRGPLLSFLGINLVLGYLSLPEKNSPELMSNWGIMLNYITAAFFGFYSSLLRYKLIIQGNDLETIQHTVLRNMDEGVIVFDEHENILLENETARKILRKSDSRKIRSLSELTEGLSIESPRGLIALQSKYFDDFGITQNTSGKVLKVIDQENQTHYLSLSICPMHSHSFTSKEFLMTIRDMTERTKTEEKLHQQEISLMIASRMSALGEMASGIAHEINNPLSVITARSEFLKRNLLKNNIGHEEVIKQIDIITNTSFRIAKIISSMQSLSRQNSQDEFVVTTLDRIIDDVLSISKERIKLMNVELLLDLEEQYSIKCNFGQIAQVIMNLVNNSLDAIEGQNEKWIKIHGKTQKGKLEITFIDSGSGIPESIREKILQPFFTTKEIGKGTGLGLSLIRTILGKHGGEIKIDPTQANTAFVITLPLAQER